MVLVWLVCSVAQQVCSADETKTGLRSSTGTGGVLPRTSLIRLLQRLHECTPVDLGQSLHELYLVVLGKPQSGMQQGTRAVRIREREKQSCRCGLHKDGSRLDE